MADRRAELVALITAGLAADGAYVDTEHPDSLPGVLVDGTVDPNRIADLVLEQFDVTAKQGADDAT